MRLRTKHKRALRWEKRLGSFKACGYNHKEAKKLWRQLRELFDVGSYNG